MTINVSKSNGPDDIPNWLLRDFCDNLAGPLCAIFNSSFREGYIPDTYKRIKISHIKSDWREVWGTVPQGKLMGVLCFFCF